MAALGAGLPVIRKKLLGRVKKYHDIFENIKISKISLYFYIFDVFDIFQKIKISNKL